jgi:hypothetical protein
LQVAPAVVRIEQRTVFCFGDGIDGQIAAREIFLERNLRPKFDRESPITGRYFPLQTRQCIFFMRVRMQEHGKVAAHLAIFQTQ